MRFHSVCVASSDELEASVKTAKPASVAAWRRVSKLMRLAGVPDGARVASLGGGVECIAPLLMPEYCWTIVDMEGNDHPSFLRRMLGDAFGNGNPFDAVVSLDNFEFIDPLKRDEYLKFLCGLAEGPAIVAGPFEAPDVTLVRGLFHQALAQFGDDSRSFLRDFSPHPLPDLETTRKTLVAVKGTVATLPGESLYSWWNTHLRYEAIARAFPGTSMASLFASWHDEPEENGGTPAYRHYLVAGVEESTISSAWVVEPQSAFDPQELMDHLLSAGILAAMSQARRNQELRSAYEAGQGEIIRLNEEWQKLYAQRNQLTQERDASVAKFRRVRDFLLTLYNTAPVKWFMPSGPIDPKTGKFRLK